MTYITLFWQQSIQNKLVSNCTRLFIISKVMPIIKHVNNALKIVIFTLRCYAECNYATVSRLSICPSVCPWRSSMFFSFHTGWNTSKISQTNTGSLRNLLTLSPAWTIWCNGNTPKLGWNRGGVISTKKSAISPKWCKIGPRLLWRTNRKSHTRFRLVPKSMTLHDLERPKCTLAEKNRFMEPIRKIWMKIHVDPNGQWHM